MPPRGVGSITGNPSMDFWAPSNIATSRDGSGWYYSIVHAFPHGVQRAHTAWGAAHPPVARNVSGCSASSAPGSCGVGNCVIRTRDLTDPTAWRAWGGSEWNVSFADPYHDDPFAPLVPEQHVCKPVLNIAFVSCVCSSI